MTKKTRPELKPAASGRPGEGLLVLSGWELSSLEIGAIAEVCVQRNQDHRYLGEQSQWTATQTWHQVFFSEEVMDEHVVLSLDARLVDPLVENPQMTYQLQVRIGAETGVGVLRLREGVMSSRAAGQSAAPVAYVSSSQSVAKEPQAPQVPEVIAQPAIELPVVPPLQAEPKKNKTGLLLFLSVLVILGIAGFFAWQHFSSKGDPLVQVVQPEVAPPIVAPVALAPASCSAQALKASNDDLVFIQACLKTNPDTEQVLAVIADAKASKRCDVVQRLYAFKGQSGDAKIALAYAREFDPATFVAGCLTAPDKETAIYWYELVLSKDPDNVEVKTRLEALRK